MINKTKGAWILARTTGNSGYSLAERQISALTSELQSEGYYLAGRSTLHFCQIGSAYQVATVSPPFSTSIRWSTSVLLNVLFIALLQGLHSNRNSGL